MSISDSLGEVLKEIQRRSELRQRLHAEDGQEIDDDEFLAMAAAGGMCL